MQLYRRALRLAANDDQANINRHMVDVSLSAYAMILQDHQHGFEFRKLSTLQGNLKGNLLKSCSGKRSISSRSAKSTPKTMKAGPSSRTTRLAACALDLRISSLEAPMALCEFSLHLSKSCEPSRRTIRDR